MDHHEEREARTAEPGRDEPLRNVPDRAAMAQAEVDPTTFSKRFLREHWRLFTAFAVLDIVTWIAIVYFFGWAGIIAGLLGRVGMVGWRVFGTLEDNARTAVILRLLAEAHAAALTIEQRLDRLARRTS